MKKIAASIIVVTIAFVSAAQGQGMNEADMKNVMQVMQKMQECMAQVDQSAIKELEERTNEMEAEIKALCEQGEEKKAEKKAIAFSKEMLKNPSLVQMKKCGEMTKGILPEGTMPSMDNEFDYSEGNVCDDLK